MRLALTGYVEITRESKFDFLVEAEAAFLPIPPAKKPSTAKKPMPIKENPPFKPKAGLTKVANSKNSFAA